MKKDTKLKHTPGPWTTKPTASLGPQYAVYPEADGPDIAIVYDHGNTEANARVIAAAPLLLTMLTRVMDEYLMRDPTGGPICQLTMEQARNAIKEARGEL